MGKFEELRVWQRAKDLAVFVYKLTSHGKISKDYGLKDQIRRASVSIPSNIAEGDELGTNNLAIRYFYIAKGSSAEVLTQAIISLEIGYIDNSDHEYIEKECKAISSMLTKLIKARSNKK
jgi:four helix bundle protein